MTNFLIMSYSTRSHSAIHRSLMTVHSWCGIWTMKMIPKQGTMKHALAPIPVEMSALSQKKHLKNHRTTNTRKNIARPKNKDWRTQPLRSWEQTQRAGTIRTLWWMILWNLDKQGSRRGEMRRISIRNSCRRSYRWILIFDLSRGFFEAYIFVWNFWPFFGLVWLFWKIVQIFIRIHI